MFMFLTDLRKLSAVIKFLGTVSTIFAFSLCYAFVPASKASFMTDHEIQQTKVMIKYLGNLYKADNISVVNAWSVQISDQIKFDDGSFLTLVKENYTEYPINAQGISVAVPDDIRNVFFDLLASKDAAFLDKLLVGWKFFPNKKPGSTSARSFFINMALKKVIYINPYSREG